MICVVLKNHIFTINQISELRRLIVAIKKTTAIKRVLAPLFLLVILGVESKIVDSAELVHNFLLLFSTVLYLNDTLY
jgi:hypothetical protein